MEGDAMPHEERIEQYLDAATAGLTGDRELQMDVRAELRSHIGERMREPGSPNPADGGGVDEALKAMGPAAELGGELLGANRSRMRWRAVIRRAAQWLLVPLSVAVALMMADVDMLRVVRMMGALSGSCAGAPEIGSPSHLTPEQRFVLLGDTSRTNAVDRQKALWERWPADKVYAHNYLTVLIGNYGDSMGPTLGARYEHLKGEVEKIRPLDPDNARFDYILASKELDQAAEITSSQTNAPDGSQRTQLAWTIKDRAKLDEAMARLKEGLGRPVYRRYTREMNVRKLEVVGRPKTLYEEIYVISILAGTLLPDCSAMRQLARASIKYGELLASEGRANEARVFLDAGKRLAIQMNLDSFTLIDVLVASAIADMGRQLVPPVYEGLGDAVRARRALTEGAALAGPVRVWKERRKARTDAAESDRALRVQGTILGGLLLPALAEYPTGEELAPGRNVEYAVAGGIVVSLLSAVFLLCMIGCFLGALMHRMKGSAPLLLLPTWSATFRLLLWSIVVPLGAYFALTHYPPLSGRDAGLVFNAPKFGLQCAVLVWLLVWLPEVLAERWVRRRCRELLIAVPPPTTLGALLTGGMLGVVALIGLLPASVLNTRNDVTPWLLLALGVGVGVGVLMLAVRAAAARVREKGAYPLFRGSALRSRIPVYAMALILVSLLARPYLRFEQQRWLARDTVMGFDTSGGFTAAEQRVTDRLKTEMATAAAGMEP